MPALPHPSPATTASPQTDEDGNIDSAEAIHNRILNPVHAPRTDESTGKEIICNTWIPLIDGGTEGWKGQARVIFPRFTACFECTVDMFPPQTTFALCTIAQTPRRPEHCVAYAMQVLWPKEFPDRKYDTDSPEDMTWIYEQAAARADQFGIAGVSYRQTLGVVKNIIPAIASTNALIAASCVNEAVKLLTFSGHTLNNYWMYTGGTGAYSMTSTVDRKPALQCMACRQPKLTTAIASDVTLQDAIKQHLTASASLQLTKPTIGRPGRMLRVTSPPSADEATRVNLLKTMGELIPEGRDVFVVTDPMFPAGVSLTWNITVQQPSGA